MKIDFVMSPVKSTGTAVTCSECGAVIADWIYAGFERTFDRSNQDIHKAWHEKIINDIAQIAVRVVRIEP